jgi:tRNA dimethylallyltransferase
MVAAGAAEEVRRLEPAGISSTARKALGFSELLAGDLEAMARRTRNYAKRQLTWMRRLPSVVCIEVTDRSHADVARAVLAAAGDPRIEGSD